MPNAYLLKNLFEFEKCNFLALNMTKAESTKTWEKAKKGEFDGNMSKELKKLLLERIQDNKPPSKWNAKDKKLLVDFVNSKSSTVKILN